MEIFDWQIMWLEKAALASVPNLDLCTFVDFLCAQNHPREFYERLIDFYLAREKYVAIPIIEHRLAQFEPEKSEERFAL